MHRTFAKVSVGVGLAMLVVPAQAQPPGDDPDQARAQALERVRTRLVIERVDAQEQGRRIAAMSMSRHARAARPE